MRYVSLFSGIGGFDLGFDRAGMTCVGQVENNPQSLSVLEKHWPDVPKWRDVRDVGKHNLPPAELYCGGFPCQDVSVAGRRKGLVGERSGLWFEFHRILEETTPEWVVIENVPGLLSSNGGRDFATVLQGLVGIGYRVCWRVLDSQYFGVPQRRRRIFIVGCLGSGRSAQVLFEPDRSTGHPAESGQEREDIANTLSASPPNRRNGGSRPTAGHFVVAGTLSAETGRNRGLGNANETDLLVFNQQAVGLHQQSMSVQTLTARDYKSPNTLITYGLSTYETPKYAKELQPTLTVPSSSGGGQPPAVMQSGVRRLTPTECERLQGFPDGHTAGQSDSVRYRQLGDAVTVDVTYWLGRRIMEAQ